MKNAINFLRKHLVGDYHIKLNKTTQLNFPKMGGIFTVGVLMIGFGFDTFRPLLYVGEALLGLTLFGYTYFYLLNK
jgi:UDP-N-acetylmuramyl pentapeptide phosphotransferase/UDP-N-acetylglucosamine-1-phosphate transferase